MTLITQHQHQHQQQQQQLFRSLSLLLCLFLLLLIQIEFNFAQMSSKTLEVCDRENKFINCSNDSVIYIEGAQYGRMKAGRCLKAPLTGPKNCSSDVRLYMERLCAGRRSCTIELNTVLDSSPHGCPTDLKTYLQFSYSCISVEIRGISTTTDCVKKHSINPMTSSGYLAKVVTMETGIGTGNCPWEIEAKSGQKISLTLLDFGVWENSASSVSASNTMDSDEWKRRDASTCIVYATVVDSGSPGQIQTICGGEGRPREINVLKSYGNKIQVTIASRTAAGAASAGPYGERYFLLRYEVVGCADIDPPPPYTVFERKEDRLLATCDLGNDGDTVEKSSVTNWTFHCVDGNWSKTEKFNCSVLLSSLKRNKSKSENQYDVLLIAGVVSVVVIVSVSVITIGLYCYFRHRIAKNREEDGTMTREYVYTLASRVMNGCENGENEEEEEQRRMREMMMTMRYNGMHPSGETMQRMPFLQDNCRRPSADCLQHNYNTTMPIRRNASAPAAAAATAAGETVGLEGPYNSGTMQMIYCPYHGTLTRIDPNPTTTGHQHVTDDVNQRPSIANAETIHPLLLQDHHHHHHHHPQDHHQQQQQQQQQQGVYDELNFSDGLQ